MKAKLFVLALLLPAFLWPQDAPIATRPPGSSGGVAFTGGTVTTPLLGPTGCTNPAYSWTGHATKGLCFDSPYIQLRGSGGAFPYGEVFLGSAAGNKSGLFDYSAAGSATGIRADGTAGTLESLVDGSARSTLTTTALTLASLALRGVTELQGSTSKALTDATATAFVRVAIVQTIGSNFEAGEVNYTIYCDDDTNQATQSGRVRFACHNLAGTESCGFGTPDGVTLGDGTASLDPPTFDATSGAVDTIDLRVNSNCTGITPNTHTFQYRVHVEATATLTPQ
jgi:hypothetical protein